MKKREKRIQDLKKQIELWKLSTINYGYPFGKYRKRINYYSEQLRRLK